ncbi:MAG: hypothetical protein HYR64_10730 [Fimbriimonas ginsengisoli]|uniref:ParE-like toxin domain-containing protein n=1 Tax=Fimbriimonas ginsengisoli TaxID=1005039 RepID=A0A931LXE6_FIMGI|nr:hypothetical protein [Fimbriimonas ginsengisoli]
MPIYRSSTTPTFRKLRSELPREIKRRTQNCYRLWRADPLHPSLHFKRIHGTASIWSVRISRGYRALGLLEGDEVVWFWIGSHDDYARTIAGL